MSSVGQRDTPPRAMPRNLVPGHVSLSHVGTWFRTCPAGTPSGRPTPCSGARSDRADTSPRAMSGTWFRTWPVWTWPRGNRGRRPLVQRRIFRHPRDELVDPAFAPQDVAPEVVRLGGECVVGERRLEDPVLVRNLLL